PGAECFGVVGARAERFESYGAQRPAGVQHLENRDGAAAERELGGLRAAVRRAEERALEALDALGRGVEIGRRARELVARHRASMASSAAAASARSSAGHVSTARSSRASASSASR